MKKSIKDFWRKDYIHILLFSVAIIMVAQLNINLFINNFKISIAIILFPVFLFLVDDFPLISVTICSGMGVFLSRIIYYWLQHGERNHLFYNYFPEALFYISYGLLLFLYFKYLKKQLDRNKSLLPLFIMDYCANMLELFCRLQYDSFSYKTQFSILIVAFIRTLVIWSIITAIDFYGFSLIRKEHTNRYRKLLLLISKLKGEVIWMQKNTSLIEDTMNTSFHLFHEMQHQHMDEALSQSVLNISKDIHEIKKEYILITRGISEALENDFQDEGMFLHEILTVLQDSLLKAQKASSQNLAFDIQCDKHIYTTKQYLLMSIFHNLFTNAIEATKEGPIHIIFRQSEVAESYLFTVTDYGSGISADSLSNIFSPGFSTKINYNTGEINRGLGLNLVQDMVENGFGGSISVTSIIGSTTFLTYIPKHQLEETL